jgi:hypothetical protein
VYYKVVPRLLHSTSNYSNLELFDICLNRVFYKKRTNSFMNESDER